MSASEGKNTLSGLRVREAMRRQVIRLFLGSTIASGIICLIKYKINALLVTDAQGMPAGVVSKTDIMGAYYAGLPLDSPLEHIMSTPPLFCSPEESVEAALGIMAANGVYRLYVIEGETGKLVGALAYPDIVGLLYRYCHGCEYSRFRPKEKPGGRDAVHRITVREVMTASVKTLHRTETLSSVLEALSAYRFGAMLITGRDRGPCGVISKTDLSLAYRRGLDVELPAESIMAAPVRSCHEDELLESAIQKMIFADIHRLFVHRETTRHIVGVLSLTDAARQRSGSCHACVSSRIRVGNSGTS